MEQRRGELPDGKPQHERTDEPHEQQRLPPGPEFRRKCSECPETPDGTDRFPVRASFGLIGEISTRGRLVLVAVWMTESNAPSGHFFLPRQAENSLPRPDPPIAAKGKVRDVSHRLIAAQKQRRFHRHRPIDSVIALAKLLFAIRSTRPTRCLRRSDNTVAGSASRHCPVMVGQGNRPPQPFLTVTVG